MASVSLREMLALARAHADATGDRHTDDTVLTAWLNIELGNLVDLVLAANDSYFRTSASFRLDGSTDEYELPANFYRLKAALFCPNSGDDAMPMRHMDLRDRGRDEEGAWTCWGEPTPRFRIDGNKFLINQPKATGTVKLEYIQGFVKLRFLDDLVEPSHLPFHWYNLPLLCAAKRIRQTNDDDTSEISRDIDMAQMTITKAAGPLDRGTAEQTRDDVSFRSQSAVWGWRR